MTLYDWLLLGHILAAIAWVGGGITITVVSGRMIRTSEFGQLAALMRTLEWMGNRVYLPAAIGVLGLGIWMVAVDAAWTIGQLWIVLALVGIGISILIGVLFIGPQGKRVNRAIEAGGPESPEARARIRRLFGIGRFDLLVLLLIVVDMVAKPGA